MAPRRPQGGPKMAQDNPKTAQDRPSSAQDRQRWLKIAEDDDYPFEFFMNRLRLVEACGVDEYEMLTGMKLPASTISLMAQAQDKGTMIITAKDWQVTALGRRYLNTLLEQLIA